MKVTEDATMGKIIPAYMKPVAVVRATPMTGTRPPNIPFPTWYFCYNL
jgi:hypothetical protein